jgi:hypothetical protein
MKEGTNNVLCSVENTKLQFSNNKTVWVQRELKIKNG